MGWRDQAECIGMDTNIFFPDGTHGVTARGYNSKDGASPKAFHPTPETAALWDLALRTCAACKPDVKAACLDDALLTPHHKDAGIRAGLTPEERQTERRRRYRSART